MRTILDKVAVATAQTITTSPLSPGARGEGWRLWDGILRCVVDGADATVRLRSSVTDEDVDVVAVVAGSPKSGALIKIPGAYYIVVDTVGVAGATVTVILDGDTGKPPSTVTVA